MKNSNLLHQSIKKHLKVHISFTKILKNSKKVFENRFSNIKSIVNNMIQVIRKFFDNINFLDGYYIQWKIVRSEAVIYEFAQDKENAILE